MAKKSIVQKTNNWIKYCIGWLVCLLIRLIPFRAIMLPNIEPVMGTIMPFAKKFKWLSGFVFGFLSIVIYDIITQKVGSWTWITAVMYGLIGVGAGFYLQNKKNKIRYYVGYSIVATLIYDAITGIVMGHYLWNMEWSVAFFGQIPFTLYHLGGNIVFAAFLSPAIYRWVVDNKNLETTNVVQKVKHAFSA